MSGIPTKNIKSSSPECNFLSLLIAYLLPVLHSPSGCVFRYVLGYLYVCHGDVMLIEQWMVISILEGKHSTMAYVP